MPFEPVVGCATPVTLQHRPVLRSTTVEFGAAPQQGVDAMGLRAVRVFLGLAGDVVLAVDCDPLAGHHAGGQPQPGTEEVADDGVQFDGAMGLGAVQEYGDRGDGDVGQQQDCENQLPGGEIEKAVTQLDVQ
jgi:hypothetical protein